MNLASKSTVYTVLFLAFGFLAITHIVSHIEDFKVWFDLLFAVIFGIAFTAIGRFISKKK